MTVILHHQHATDDDRATCEQVQYQAEELRKLRGDPCPHCGHSETVSPVVEEEIPLPVALEEETAADEELTEAIEELTEVVEELAEEIEDSGDEEPSAEEESEESGSVEELDVSDESEAEEEGATDSTPPEERSSERRFASRR